MPAGTDRDQTEIHALITAHLDLCEIIARQLASLCGPTIEHEEIVAIARESLTVAAQHFDDGLGVPFRRYANVRVKGGVIDAVRRRGNVPRRVYRALRALESANELQEAMVQDQGNAPPPTPEEADAKLDQYLSQASIAMAMGLLSIRVLDEETLKIADQKASPEENVEREQLFARMKEAMKGLSEQELRLVQGHYFEGKTVAEIGREMGLSKSWSCRLHARAVEVLAGKLGAR